MRGAERERFDRLLEAVLAALPRRLHDLLEESPLIVEDRPDAALIEELGLDLDNEVLCGLHTGRPLTERSVVEEAADALETIHLFREAIVIEAGGWGRGDDAVREEIRVTLLHEVGHHFGLDEDDLERLGYD